MSKSYSIRGFHPDDIPFLHSSWGSSYYTGATYNKFLGPGEFHKHHRPIRESIFDRPCSSFDIVCSTDDPGLIMAWMSWEKPEDEDFILIHYLYVKQAFKGEGLARELLLRFKDVKPVLITHLTEQAERIIHKNHLKLFYCPHLT